MPIISEIWHDANLFLKRIDSNIFEENSQENDIEDTNSTNCSAITNFKAGFLDKHGNIEKIILDIEIESYLESNVDLVGLQVWRGALLLADYIIMHQESFKNKNILELAAGTGLTSIVAVLINIKAMKNGNGSLTCTDINRGPILPLIEGNFQRNSIPLKDTWNMNDKSFKVKVAEIDFFKKETYCDATKNHQSNDNNGINFQNEEDSLYNKEYKLNKDNLRNIDVIFAADVVYDENITHGFFTTLNELSSQALLQTNQDHDLHKVPKHLEIYLSIEKRCRVTALTGEKLNEKDCYELEKDSLTDDNKSSEILAPNFDVFIKKLKAFIYAHNNDKFSCKIEEIPLSTIDQYFWNYERVEELVLFKLILRCRNVDEN